MYWTSSRCTRERVAAETSARSLSTWRRWPATHRRGRNGFQGGAAVPGHCSTPFRWPQLPWNRAGRSSSRQVTRSVSMLDSIMSIGRIRPRERLPGCLSSTLTNTLTRRRWGPTVLPRTEVSHATGTLDGVWSGRLTFARAGASCADRQSSLQGYLAEDVMIHLRAGFSKTRQIVMSV